VLKRILLTFAAIMCACFLALTACTEPGPPALAGDWLATHEDGSDHLRLRLREPSRNSLQGCAEVVQSAALGGGFHFAIHGSRQHPSVSLEFTPVTFSSQVYSFTGALTHRDTLSGTLTGPSTQVAMITLVRRSPLQFLCLA
jgi:hypothetical protein